MVANAGHTGAISIMASDGCEEVLSLEASMPFFGALFAPGFSLQRAFQCCAVKVQRVRIVAALHGRRRIENHFLALCARINFAAAA